MDQESQRPHSIFWPLLLIALGLFLLFNTLGYVRGNAWEIVLRLWPLLFIVGSLDGLYRRENFVAPIVFIGIGTMILLSNFGYLEIGSWMQFVRLWPVILIAIGLDLLVGHRTVASAALGILLGLALMAGVVWFVVSQPQVGAGVQRESISQDLQGATSADVEITDVLGDINIGAGAASGQLVSGEISVPANSTLESQYSVEDGVGSYRLKNENVNSANPVVNTRNLTWDLQLSGDVPLDLKTQTVVGQQLVDLTGLQIEALDVETVIGQAEVLLPAEGVFDGEVSVVIGELLLIVPSDTAIRIQADTGLTGISVPQGWTRENGEILSPGAAEASERIELRVDVPMGSLRVEYAE